MLQVGARACADRLAQIKDDLWVLWCDGNFNLSIFANKITEEQGGNAIAEERERTREENKRKKESRLQVARCTLPLLGNWQLSNEAANVAQTIFN